MFDNERDTADLKRAVILLETPSITIRLVNIVGTPIEWGVSRLPQGVVKKVQSIAQVALRKSVSVALKTLDDVPTTASSTRMHKFAAAATGAVGGFFGLGALAVELPITTTIMMRSIVDVARSEGFTINDLAVQKACVEVFALGGKSDQDDASDSGYYASRGMLTETVRQTTRELIGVASQRSGEGAAKAVGSSQIGSSLAKLIDAVATRFGVVITEKMAAQIVPVLGAASGAAINAVFTDHYQEMARGHFIVRRLEEKYGKAMIEAAYRRLL
ncbi:EcsC family protein [Alcaligenaceae bacterium CGII-47]|nr:EcsC family protein [Alcaligenaceae bacterium CGII-47]